MIHITRLCSMERLREAAAHEVGELTAIWFDDKDIVPGYRCMERMEQYARDTQAAMVYADYLDPRPHPLTDCLPGSLRDDMDLGGLWVVRTELLRAFLRDETAEWEYMAPYALRLYLSRHGRVAHLREMLYTQLETDKRRSGERQFDYVDPRNAAVQKEAERVCTAHLKAVGAWLGEEETDELPEDTDDYEVEASVIIPVRNRVRTIADAIGSVLEQKADFSYNVIVVDNGSDDGTGEAIDALTGDGRVVCLRPERNDLGIGGCWDMAVRSPHCGRYAVQLDSDDLYSSENSLQRIVDKFREENAAMVIGSYRMVDFGLNTLPPGLIDHREWTRENGRNNALRINGLGAPRAFRTDIIRSIGFPNTSYGEDYAVGLAISRRWKIGRIYEELYLCRRWDGNSDAALSIEKQNKNDLYKDSLRTEELLARMAMVKNWRREVSETEVDVFFDRQLDDWPEVRERFEDLKIGVVTKSLDCEVQESETTDGAEQGCILAVQHNPRRIVSTGAKTDALTLEKRPCFLCDKNRPPVQSSLPVEGKYQVLVNPFPILPHHLTIASRRHNPQELSSGLGALMSRMAWNMPGYVVFYNGPRSGASAPDHAHLQAGRRGIIPLEAGWRYFEERLERVFPLTSCDERVFEQKGYHPGRQGIFLLRGYACPAIVIKGERSGSAELLNMVMAALGRKQAETRTEDTMSDSQLSARHVLQGLTLARARTFREADVNVIAWKEYDTANDAYDIVTVVFPRRKHRPQCYYSEGADKLLISPGAVDMGGLLVAPRREDFDSMMQERASAILREVSMTEEDVRDAMMHLVPDETQQDLPTAASKLGAEEEQPMVSVGLMAEDKVAFVLNSPYEVNGCKASGEQEAGVSEGKILWNGNTYDELVFRAVTESSEQETSVPTFTVCDVRIGKKFHWERRENQTFTGNLHLRVENDKIVVINELTVEEYLRSVISSEMSQNSSLEFLKAHAVISRSWLLFQQERRRTGGTSHPENIIRNENEYIRWYDNNEHTLFDVCADDHCQRYQGMTKATNPVVARAVGETAGQVLSYSGEVCDARFSKCCGGHTETYSTCWDDRDVPYLQSVYDGDEDGAYCDTHYKKLLAQILNDYDQETSDFFSWQVRYSNKQLTDLLLRKTGEDFGRILSLRPLSVGPGGHVSRLEICGEKKTLIVGKELEIRRILSESHLYSSAFTVEADADGFTLNGRGWGHGVGLCQIGAAVMAEKGFGYREILKHYYPQAEIEKIY